MNGCAPHLANGMPMMMEGSSKFVSGSGLRSHAVERSSLRGGVAMRSICYTAPSDPCFSLRFARIKVAYSLCFEWVIVFPSFFPSGKTAALPCFSSVCALANLDIHSVPKAHFP